VTIKGCNLYFYACLMQFQYSSIYSLYDDLLIADQGSDEEIVDAIYQGHRETTLV